MKTNLMTIKRYVNKHGWDDVSREMFDRRIERRVHKQKVKELKPITEVSRCYYYREDYDSSFCEFWLEDLQGWTDEDIKEYVEDMWERINSPYDCTGKRFTIYIHWHRNPCGLVSFVHYMGIDL